MLAALIIVFREVVEAGLIIGIVLAASQGVPGRIRVVVGGVVGGVLAACLVAAFAGQIGDLFEGSGQEIFQAAVLGGAVLMLGWHNVWMAKHGRDMANDMRAVGRAVAAGESEITTLGIVVGLAVMREGSEVVLFLYGISAQGAESAWSMLIGGVLGMGAGVLIGLLLYRGLLAIPVHKMFTATAWLITLMAAGMASQAVGFLQQSGLVTLWQEPLWDTSGILAQTSLFGRVLHTLVGYTDQPDGLQLLAWVVTVAVIWCLGRIVNPPRQLPLGRGGADAGPLPHSPGPVRRVQA